jgi:hypothetical protein
VANLNRLTSNIMSKNLIGFVALLLFFSKFAYAQPDLMGYAEFLPDRYTSNFKKGVQSKLIGTATIEKQKMAVEMLLSQEAGNVSKYDGKKWMQIKSSGSAKLGSESVNVSLVQYYDLKTKLKIYEIDVDEEKTTQYEWRSIPKNLRFGDLVEVGSYKEKDKSGKLVGIGIVSYRLTQITNGYEFCQIESGKDLESDEHEIVEDCDQFTQDKKLTGQRVKVKIGKDTEIEVSGKSILR